MAKHNSEEADIYDILSSRFTPEQSLKSRKTISTAERGVCYTAVVEPERETVVFQVDNCIITDGNRCDKLVLSKHPADGDGWIGHFVELKGRNIRHAIEQLSQSLQYAIFSHKTLKKRYARVVGRSFPANAGDLEFERARARFRNLYKCELKRIKSHQPDCI